MSIPAPEPQVIDVDGVQALVVGGTVQSIAVTPGAKVGSYWQAMLPDQRPTRVLLLGLGAGTLAHLLTQRFGAVPMVGVEVCPEVVALARAHFDLDRLAHLRVVVADAFAFVTTCTDCFDQIYVDLFVGKELARGVVARPFLRQLRRLAALRGTVTFNFFHDRRSGERLHRLRRVFSVVRPIEVGKNLVVWCRP